MSPFTVKADPIVTLREVGVCFRQRTGLLKHQDFWALENVSLNLYHGETLGVIGRNGAGKTSLLKVIAGIIAPNRGYLINDKNLLFRDESQARFFNRNSSEPRHPLD